jgi:uncharacterized protein (UPF0333 family)
VPFSADNPNRNRNFVILILAVVLAFAILMGTYVALALAGEDTDAFMRFLTILVVTLIPSALAAIRANSAAQNSEKAVSKVTEVQEKLNGNLDERMRQANRDTTEEDKNGR